MNIFDIEITYLVVIANAVLLAAAALAILRFSRHYRELLAFRDSPTGVAVAVDRAESDAINPDTINPDAINPDAISKLLKATMRLERRVDNLHKQLLTISNRPERIASDVTRPLPIDNAARMARGGASIEELTRACGLNIGEAKLLRQLHARRVTTASV